MPTPRHPGGVTKDVEVTTKRKSFVCVCVCVCVVPIPPRGRSGGTRAIGKGGEADWRTSRRARLRPDTGWLGQLCQVAVAVHTSPVDLFFA